MRQRTKALISSLVGAMAILAAPLSAHAEPYWQCAPFARMFSGIQIFGDAWTWWSQAAGKYQTGFQPAFGAVLVFKPQGSMNKGHVATVSSVLTDRVIQVTHANWSRINGSRGQIEKDVTMIDVSPAGDWSQVKVWYDPVRDLGTTTYPTYGFIYQDDNALTLASAARSMQSAMTVVASAVPNAVVASGQVMNQVSQSTDKLATLIQQQIGGASRAD